MGKSSVAALAEKKIGSEEKRVTWRLMEAGELRYIRGGGTFPGADLEGAHPAHAPLFALIYKTKQ